MRVMIIDDEEWCLEELSEMLAEVEEIEVTGTYSVSSEALQAAARDAPDLVFIDVQMPVISGLDLAVSLKKQKANLHVVLMSDKECFARQGFDIGADDYILKPLKSERVLRALKRLKQ